MIVKAAPRFATILWRWLGSYMLLASGEAQALVWCMIRTLAMPIGDMVSAILIVGGVSAIISGVFLVVLLASTLSMMPRRVSGGTSVRAKAYWAVL
jgi:hypothetical protein